MNFKGLCERVRAMGAPFYDCEADILEYSGVYGSGTFIYEHVPVEKYSGVKCRMSYKSSPTLNMSGVGGKKSQTVTVFLPPDIDVAPGSVFKIKKGGETFVYQHSGIHKVYDTHQEIEAKNEGEFA